LTDFILRTLEAFITRVKASAHQRLFVKIRRKWEPGSPPCRRGGMISPERKLNATFGLTVFHGSDRRERAFVGLIP
jgi:hypothetical protein